MKSLDRIPHVVVCLAVINASTGTTLAVRRSRRVRTTIITYGGSNLILAGEGNDLVYLNGDLEEVEGGGGADRIWGLGATTARISGDAGNDLIVGSPGDDLLSGGLDDDFIFGAGGADTISGDEGNDTLFGGSALDEIDGGIGEDTCSDVSSGATFISCEITPANPGFPEAGRGGGH